MSAALALLVTLGGQAERPARHATPGHGQLSETPIRFRRLQLIRPWHGRVEYGVRAGVVYLTGFATIKAGTSTAIAVLPASIRPRNRLYLLIAAVPARDLTIQITPSGRVLLSGPHGSRTSQIWLSGVHFPAGGP